MFEKLQHDTLVDVDELIVPGGQRQRTAEALNMLASRRVIEFLNVSQGQVLCTAVATGRLASFDFLAGRSQVKTESQYQVSRFACARRKGSQLVVESPHRFIGLTIFSPQVASVVAALAHPESVNSLMTGLSFIEPRVLTDVLEFLVGTGTAMEVDHDGKLPEDQDHGMSVREFHDVLMHAHSRYGLTDERIGGTFRFAGKIPPWPVTGEERCEESIDIPKPTSADFARGDLPLGQVMEARRSVRIHGATPLTLGQLGEFLFRVGRIRSVRTAHATDDPRSYDITNRTYPSGGAAYDIEIYPLVSSCQGLEQGLYHYDPVRHRLGRITSSQALLQNMVSNACLASGTSSGPQVLLVLTSRFGRLAWKYSGMAYATTLRNVGVLYEAMYLTATAMGLAPCALGCGDSALFSAAAGLDPLVESSVGEFMLGSLPGESANGRATQNLRG